MQNICFVEMPIIFSKNNQNLMKSHCGEILLHFPRFCLLFKFGIKIVVYAPVNSQVISFTSVFSNLNLMLSE